MESKIESTLLLTRIGRLAQREQLPQDDTEGPDVRLSRKDAVYDRFDGHPLNRQRALIVVVVDIISLTQIWRG